MTNYYRLVIWYGINTTDTVASEFQYVRLADALRMLAGFVDDIQCYKAELWFPVDDDEPSFRYVRGRGRR